MGVKFCRWLEICKNRKSLVERKLKCINGITVLRVIACMNLQEILLVNRGPGVDTIKSGVKVFIIEFVAGYFNILDKLNVVIYMDLNYMHRA